MNRHSTVDVPFAGAWAFLAIAFGIVWTILFALLAFPEEIEELFGSLNAAHPLFILAVWSPAISAWSVILYTTGWSGFRGYLTRFRVWRCGWGWAIVIALIIPLIYYLGSWLKGAAHFSIWPFESIRAGLSAIALMAVLGPIEEFGWRDLLQPVLQRRLAPLWVGIIVGFVWGIWHLPAFFLSGLPQSNWDVLPFLIGTVAVSVIITPLFNVTQGGILLPMIFHFQLNNPIWPDALPFDIPLFVLLALITTLIYRHEMLDRSYGVTRVTGLGAGPPRALECQTESHDVDEVDATGHR